MCVQKKCLEQLVVFTRYPEAGVTKTRLIPLLGPVGSAMLQRRLTERVVIRARKVRKRRTLKLEIRHDGGRKDLMRKWLGTDLDYGPQGPGDVGRRMERSFRDAFQAGKDAVVLVGSDIPQMTDVIMDKAFERLKRDDLVLGPAKDGGYYLIGMKKTAMDQSLQTLFENMDWGSTAVLPETLHRVRRLSATFSLLDTLSDLDHPEDFHLNTFVGPRKENKFPEDDISIVVPTLNEADNIAATLATVDGARVGEVIVVDGGSKDDTVAIATQFGARVIPSRPPRARQMNQGASAAKGRLLLFLHGDTGLPPEFDRLVVTTAEQPDFAAGAFSLRIDSPRPGLKVMESVANWRSRFLNYPYGDQAIFLSQRLFQSMGGFADLPIMEDFDLIRRLKKVGRIITLPQAVITASRRWDNFGILRTWLVNQIVVAAFLMGMAPEKVVRLYQRGRGTRPSLSGNPKGSKA
jgi:rSAM/selenodomain-associated transferase 2/rSAM/selenodomain-associated transferase 1